MVLPLPSSAFSSSTAPCTMQECATVAPGPTSTTASGAPCRTELSCTLAPSRTMIVQMSARSTAPYQTLAPFSMVTSPISVAVGATKASGWTVGRLPSNSKRCTQPRLVGFGHFSGWFLRRLRSNRLERIRVAVVGARVRPLHRDRARDGQARRCLQGVLDGHLDRLGDAGQVDQLTGPARCLFQRPCRPRAHQDLPVLGDAAQA